MQIIGISNFDATYENEHHDDFPPFLESGISSILWFHQNCRGSHRSIEEREKRILSGLLIFYWTRLQGLDKFTYCIMTQALKRSQVRQLSRVFSVFLV